MCTLVYMLQHSQTKSKHPSSSIVATLSSVQATQTEVIMHVTIKHPSNNIYIPTCIDYWQDIPRVTRKVAVFSMC